ncbi:regulatory protein [Actinomycetospora succinea]|uniref:Regulatory protein RecX n=1 Tax=Actinomycetospora succinea TaxID=663603 RepID=A0A4R6VYS3_9PSEU|nr:regulatory protein RecX [Actinomycetospora succinea]TDQ65755.1 regulatory protein [Actinomycetospora succinea]
MAIGQGAGRRRTSRGRAPEPPDPDGHDAQADPPADPASVARTICLNMLTTRARSRAELADALARKDVPDDVAGRVLDRLAAAKLVDDAAFAEQWVSSRHRHQGLGKRALAGELHRKGVERETATTAIDEISRDDEQARARALVDRRLPSLARFDDAVAARRLVGMLARKGYDAGVAYTVVREALAQRSPTAAPEGEDGAGSLDDLLAGAEPDADDR